MQLLLTILFILSDVANAITTSGWETEGAVVKTKTGTSWPPYYAYPYIAYNLRGDGRYVLISGQEAYGGYFGYYWNNTDWIGDSSLVSGLSAHAWNEAPALAYNVTGDNKWTLIGHAGSAFYGYYWDGTQWVNDDSRVTGLSASGQISHTLLDNLLGDGKWTLITGTDSGAFKIFYWDGAKWVEDAARASGLPMWGTNTRVSAGYNVYGNSKWTLIAASYSSGTFRNFYWNGTSWIEDASKTAGLDMGNMTNLAPALGYNLRGDNKWVLVSGLAYNKKLLGFFYNNVDTSALPQIQNVTVVYPLATTVKIDFSYPYSWNYDIEYSENSDMSNQLWANTQYRSIITDVSGPLEFKLYYLKPGTTYYYQVYAYVPWDYSYYSISPVQTFTTLPSQNYIIVNPGDSIQDAVETLPLEGGTVELAAGTHNLNYTMRILSNNITFKGQGIDKTIIQGGGIYASRYDDGPARVAYMYANAIKGTTFCTYSNGNPQDFVRNVIFGNFTMHNPAADGINIVQGWNISISNVKLYRDGSVANSGIYFGYARDSVVRDSTIANFNRGVFYWAPHGNDIVNNEINNTWEALEYNGGYTCTGLPLSVHENKIKNTFADAMFLYSGSGWNINGNIVENAGTWHSNYAAIAFVLGSVSNASNNILKNNWIGLKVQSKNNYNPPRTNMAKITIRNNLIYNSSQNGILFNDDYSIPLTQQNFVYSNTIYGNGQGGIENSQGHNITLKNNIIAGNKRYGVNGINTLNTYNDVWNNTLGNYNGTSAGTGDISADPLFANVTAGDFHLKSQAGRWNGTAWVLDSAASPAIDAGDSTSDYSSEPTPNGNRINIGAYGNTKEASKSLSATGILSGTVSNGTSPIQGAIISTSSYSNTTNSTGNYKITLPVGNYTVTASAGGYQSQAKNATVLENQTTVVNFNLTAAITTTTSTTTTSTTTTSTTTLTTSTTTTSSTTSTSTITMSSTTSTTSTTTASTTSTSATTTSTTAASTSTTTSVTSTSVTSSTSTLPLCQVKGDLPPCDGLVDDWELLDYINKWAKGLVPDFDLLEAIKNWATV